jgi:type III secretion system regulator LcrR
MFQLYDDPFTQYLRQRGVAVGVYQPGGFLGFPPVGWRIQVGKSFFVYRVPEETPEILLIVLFEREGERNGLRSPFADIVRFISMVKKSKAPIHFIKGHVDVVSDRPADHLETDKIAAFYKRYLAAHHVSIENGIEWVAGDLGTYVPPLAAQRGEEK